MKKICTILFLIVSSIMYAQQTTISGSVVDEKGEPLFGATVLIKNMSIGTVTDFDGNFVLNVPEPIETKVVEISIMGFITKSITIGDKTKFDVVLLLDTETLDEVVVVGYGTVKKSDLTGAVASVKAQDIEKSGALNFDQAIQGRAAGVVVTQSSGSPGAGSVIRIRGISSLNGSDPLYIIDGIPMDNTSSGGLGDQDLESQSLSPLAMINPADIESVEILKDASSTAIYGSRGANGVVLITTKKGKTGKGVISITHESGITEIPKFVDVLEANDYYILYEEAYVNSGDDVRNQVRLDSARAGLLENNDWQKTIIHTGTTTNTNVTLSGGNEGVKYLIANNFLDTKGIVQGTDYQRVSSRVNLDAKMTDKLNVGARINYAHVTSNQRSINTGVNDLRGATSAITRALRSAPTTNIDAENEDEGVNLWTPVTAIEANKYNNLLTQFIGSMFLAYKISKPLTFRTTFSYQNRNTSQRYYQFNILPNNIAQGGRARTSDIRVNTTSFTNTLNYHKGFKGGHNLTVVLGQSLETFENEGVYVSNYGFANDLLTYFDPGSASFYDPDRIRYSDHRLASFFGRANYGYRGKYLLTLTARYDGSSKFAANNKWAFFPAAAAAYNLAKEDFLKDSQSISALKFRVSYGISGNQAIQPYQSLDQYASSQAGFGDGAGGERLTTVYYAGQLPNENLTWETTAQFDLGLDFGFLRNKITGSVEYYNKVTDDLLFTGNRIPVQSSQSRYTENAGSLITNGVEFSLKANIFLRDKFSWTVTGNVSTGKTKVQSLQSDYIFSGWDPGFISGGTQRLIIGEDIGTFFGYKTSGVAQFDDFVEFQGLTKQEQIDKYNADPGAGNYTFVDGFDGGVPVDPSAHRPGEQLYEDVADENGVKDGVFNENDRQIIGSAQPDVNFGIDNSFNIGPVDFSFFIDGSVGQKVANIQNMFIHDFGAGQGLTLKTQRWTPEVPSSTYPRVDSNNVQRVFSDRYIEDASFVRLKNVLLGYNFENGLVKKLNMNSLRLYVVATNLVTLSKYTGYNPDVSIRGSATGALGHDNGGYPLGRTVTMGIKVAF